jgi:hypothetical protein
VILRWLRRRARRTRDALSAELMTEPAIRGPEQALYRSGSGPYPRVKGNGYLALTRERLVFRILVGKSVAVPLGEITGLREEKWFRGARTGGHIHLIVETTRGELAFFTSHNAAWISAIKSAAGCGRSDDLRAGCPQGDS